MQTSRDTKRTNKKKNQKQTENDTHLSLGPKVSFLVLPSALDRSMAPQGAKVEATGMPNHRFCAPKVPSSAPDAHTIPADCLVFWFLGFKVSWFQSFLVH